MDTMYPDSDRLAVVTDILRLHARSLRVILQLDRLTLNRDKTHAEIIKVIEALDRLADLGGNS